MNLIIDVGNTYTKLAVFAGDELVEKRSINVNEFEVEFKFICKEYPNLKSCIVSSVGKLAVKNVKLIENNLRVLRLNVSTPIPFKNLYKTPDTLGVDRLALVSASAIQYPNKNVLIIDAGTCITYDFIDHKNQYLGGSISPGIQMRYKSLNNLTANLPLLNFKEPEFVIGNTTNEAIHSGVIYGVLNEIDGFIEAYKQKYADLTVILTGGSSNFLAKQLKSSIFATSNFLLEGLNYILQFNSKE